MADKATDDFSNNQMRSVFKTIRTLASSNYTDVTPNQKQSHALLSTKTYNADKNTTSQLNLFSRSPLGELESQFCLDFTQTLYHCY